MTPVLVGVVRNTRSAVFDIVLILPILTVFNNVVQHKSLFFAARQYSLEIKVAITGGHKNKPKGWYWPPPSGYENIGKNA